MADDPLLSDPIPPFCSSGDLTLPDDFTFFDEAGLDITFDDFNLPSDTEDFLNSTVNRSNLFDLSTSDPEFHDFVSNCSPNCNENCSGNCSGNYGSDVAGFLNIPSPDGSGVGDGYGDESMKSVRVLDNLLTESRDENPVSSQGSGNCGSDGSEGAMNNSMNCPSPESGNSVVEQKVKRETETVTVLKRKNESCDVNSTVKYRRSNEASGMTEDSSQVDEKDEKKKARLIRNRESAQLSRQRKKHYVEELEDKVRAMHATIQDLNARITYFAAENATLKQQMVTGAGAGGVGGGVCAPPVMYPPHPGMAPMGYPWMPCPPYVVKPQGSQVPLVPIPRLKPQQPASSQKSKKVEVKKGSEGVSKTKTKTKRVAGISFVGLLLFILLFGGLVPIMNVKLGGVVTNGVYSVKSNDYKIYNQQHHGRVLMSDDHLNGTNRNASEPLVASLYVPRNDKLVKIDGNLIIHSVLASEKAMASREEQGMSKKEDLGLAVSQDLVPAISIPAVKLNGGRQPHMYRSSSDHQRALASDKENLKSKHADGKLQQWFREGLAGPMLSSGMCTEVFQFDVSSAIVPATSVVNITATENHHNSTYISTMKNRRILHGLPVPLSTSAVNLTKEQVSAATEANDHDSNHNEPHHKNNSVSPMVVSVLFDPREAGDGGDVDGVMGGGAKGKSFSRIFVVVLLDSVKYVTYSCMLPLKGASHLVTA
ncbi:bZIP transcription factor 17 [Helianthus annuus]|uniref:Putative basic-leucine zipper (BZIP) transcription factor family protein n=1 Tax=Helianthus annuus TaxID=4232 RepID=A0A251SMX4_HELAN|nr:bZIP transcription factor 17 [Helianthus annuus]KAJ0496222.1 putative transcription factor bZIP family [Helianthus annuus]